MAKKADKATIILDAAQAVLAREGFSGTTIANVAREAGVSRGLLHYYFEDKEDLLAQMLRRSTEDSWEIVRSIMAGAESREDFADKITRAMRKFSQENPGALSLLAEGLAVSRTHPRIQAELTALHREGQEILTTEFRAWKVDKRIEVSAPPSGLATILIALLDGLGLELQAIQGLAGEEDTWTAFRESLVRLLG